MRCRIPNNELPHEFLIEFQDKLRLVEEKYRYIENSIVKINGLIREAALFYDADCAFVVEIDWTVRNGVVSYEYSANAQESIIHRIISFPDEGFEGWENKLRNNQPALIDISKVTDEWPRHGVNNEWSRLQYLMIIPFMKCLNTGIVVVGNPRVYRHNISFLSVVSSMIVSDMNEIKVRESFDLDIRQYSVRNETNIFVRFLGGLEIKAAGGVLTDENISSDLCYRLFVYLILNRDKTKPVREISDILWSDLPISNPYRDVKNVVYRLKKLLCTIELGDLIIGTRGTFIINPQYRIYTDYEKFEEVCNRYFLEHNTVTENNCFHTARQLYRGSLLPKCDHLHWLIPRIAFYQGLYLKLLKKYLLVKWNEEEYSVVQKIALEGLNNEPYDTDFMVFQLLCMYRLGNRSLAKSYYGKIESDLSYNQKRMIQEYAV